MLICFCSHAVSGVPERHKNNKTDWKGIEDYGYKKNELHVL